MSAEERLAQEETNKKVVEPTEKKNDNDDDEYNNNPNHERVEMVDEGKQSQQRIIHAELGEMTELESLCPKCEQNGTTRLMITDIPFFKKIIVSSFHCPHCGEDNTETQFGGEYGPKRTRYHLHVKGPSDMSRQLVKSEYATLKIPELELEMPHETQKGSLNTIEGLLVQTIEGLQMEQPVRRVMQPEFAKKIDDFCAKIETFRGGEIPFSVILDDPAGNSFIEPKYDYWHPTVDPRLQLFSFTRSPAERKMLGLPDGENDSEEYLKKHAVEENQSGDVTNPAAIASSAAKRKELHDKFSNHMRTQDEEDHLDAGELSNEVIELDEHCPACLKDSKVKMHPCNIPHFRETIIMAFKCDHCGYKSTEIQTGGAVPEKGRKITLYCQDESDLKRDVLKSNTASLVIPELELELVAGTLGGFFTTIEGLLSQIHDNLKATRHADFTNSAAGDSKAYENAAEEAKEPGCGERMQTSMGTWLKRVQEAIDGKILPLTFILDDPMAAVYVQNPRAHLPPPDNEDPKLKVEEYTRTFEQDEDLGLHDMVV